MKSIAMNDTYDAHLVTTAYAEVGEFYRNSVEVTKYTWKSFEVRATGIFVAAAYIFVKYPGLCHVAMFLLSVGVIMSLVTAEQMKKNQMVIQRALAAGIFLEYRYKDLGFLYRNTIPYKLQPEYETKYSKGVSQISHDDTLKLGENPLAVYSCYAHSFVFSVAIVIVLYTALCPL